MPESNPPKTFESIKQVAEYCNLSWQAIYVSVRKGTLKAKRRTSNWEIHLEDVEQYRRDRWNRDRLEVDGELVFDALEGRMSISQAAKMMSKELKETYPTQKLYYMVRKGHIKSFRRGSSWVLLKEDVIDLINKELLARGILKRIEQA